MGKLISRLVVGLAVLYALGATAFAFAHYPAEKPDVPTILSDWNGWLGSLLAVKHGPSPAPEAPGAPATVPPVAPVPADPPPVEGEPLEGPPGRLPPEGLEGEALALWKIEYQVLPAAQKSARALRTMTREDSANFERARTEILAALSETRPLLNEILEREPDHRQANRLWSTMQGIYGAVKKL